MSAARSIRRRPETVLVAALLSAVGGFLDAYTFLSHGVFANAQSGNVVMIMVDAAQRDWGKAATRLPPMGAFVLGLVAAHLLSTGRARTLLRRPTRWVLAAEILVLAVLGALPAQVPTAVITAVVSFVAALQVTTFRSVGGLSYNTTMATGNLRTLVAEAFTAVVDHDSAAAHRSGIMACLVAAFGGGALLGALATRAWQGSAVWAADVLLVLVLVAIVAETRQREGRAGRPAGGRRHTASR